MFPQTHFLFPFFLGGILTVLGYFSWPLAVLAGIIGVIVDVDHLFEHVLHAKTDKWSLRKTWNQSIQFHQWHQRSFLHHSSGELLVTALLLMLAPLNVLVALALGIGYFTHIVLDDIHIQRAKYYRCSLLGWRLREEYHEIVFDFVLVIAIVALVSFAG